jgi:hypothetical protein
MNQIVASTSAAGWLASRSPQEVETKLASLLSSHGVTCQEEREITFCTEGPNGEMIPAREPRVIGMRVHGEVTEELAERLEHFLTPAPQEAIEQWLAELAVISAKRADDGFTEELRLTAYARRLAEYPADLVRHVLLEMRWKFFPTWHELAEHLDAMKARREYEIRAVQRRACRPAAEQYEQQTEKEPQMSEDEREARRQRMAEMAEETLKAMRRNMGVPQKGCWK